MAQAQTELNDCELPELVPEKARVIGSIIPARSLSSEVQTQLEANRSKLYDASRFFSEPFPNQRPEIEKLQWAYLCISQVHSELDFQLFFNALRDVDEQTYERFGGQILLSLEGRENYDSIKEFDDKYLILIQLLAHADLALAIALHERAEKLWINFANSFVRYTRLQTALENTRQGLLNQQDAGANICRILPTMQGGIRQELISATSVTKVLKGLEESDSVQWHIPHKKIYHRSFQRFTTADDSAKADVKWINATVDTDVAMFTVMSVPDARICRAPTGIAWKQNNRYRFNYNNSDMYHYFRMSGLAAFSLVTRHLETAYFLPRIGNNNQYHSLVDKLPALLGYTLLGLNCPIVSTYALDVTEKYFCEQLGINPDTIIYDSSGGLIADRGIVADVEGLRAPFFEYCRNHRLNKSRFGEKIYITRANTTERPLVNELDIQKLMLKHGFGIVAMENYSILEQMAIARNAKVIVSPHGAGLSNMIFAQAGTAIVELIPDRYMTPLFKQLAIDCNHQYSCLLGHVDTTTEHIESTLKWQIDLSKLESLLIKTRDLQDRYSSKTLAMPVAAHQC